MIVYKGYNIAGSMTVVTATHLALLFMDEFLNFPKNSLTRDRHFFNCALPLPSEERKIPQHSPTFRRGYPFDWVDGVVMTVSDP